MNVFVLKAALPEVAIKDIFKGLNPFYCGRCITAIVAGFLPYIDAIFSELYEVETSASKSVQKKKDMTPPQVMLDSGYLGVSFSVIEIDSNNFVKLVFCLVLPLLTLLFCSRALIRLTRRRFQLLGNMRISPSHETIAF